MVKFCYSGTSVVMVGDSVTPREWMYLKIFYPVCKSCAIKRKLVPPCFSLYVEVLKVVHSAVLSLSLSKVH